MLRRVLERTGQAQRLLSRGAVGHGHLDEAHPAGGHRAGLVQDDRVHGAGRLEDLGAPDQQPELRAAAGADHERGGRRQAERARAGDDQHGDRRCERVGSAPAEREPGQPAWPPTARSRRARTLPETRSASRWTGALPAWASVTSRAIWATAVSAPTLVARTTSRPPAFTVAPATSRARSHLDRHRLAGEHAHVDGRGALLDHAVGRDLLAGPHDEAVARHQSLDRHAPLGAVRLEQRHVLRAQLEQRRDRGAGAPLRAGLEPAAGEDEGRDDGRRLEVGVRVPRTARRPTRSTRPARRRRRACPSWRRRCLAFAQAAAWNGQAPQITTGVASANATHCQPSNWSGGTIDRSSTGSESAALTIKRRRSECGRIGRRPRSPGSVAAVSDSLDRADSCSGCDRGRVEVDGRALGRVVDRRHDAVHVVQAALDAVRARRARHARDRKLQVLAAAYPPRV